MKDMIETIKDLIGSLSEANTGENRSRENSLAITKLEEAVLWLQGVK